MSILGVKAVEVAKTHLGEHELTGHNDGKFVNEVQDFVAPGLHGEPWCACFATFCIKRAAEALGLGPVQPIMPRSDSSTEIHSWAKRHGALLDTPEPGCIGLVRGDGGSPGKTHHHTFLVDRVEGGLVHSVDGNSSNKVALATHNIVDCDWVMVI